MLFLVGKHVIEFDLMTFEHFPPFIFRMCVLPDDGQMTSHFHAFRRAALIGYCRSTSSKRRNGHSERRKPARSGRCVLVCVEYVYI